MTETAHPDPAKGLTPEPPPSVSAVVGLLLRVLSDGEAFADETIRDVLHDAALHDAALHDAALHDTAPRTDTDLGPIRVAVWPFGLGWGDHLFPHDAPALQRLYMDGVRHIELQPELDSQDLSCLWDLLTEPVPPGEDLGTLAFVRCSEHLRLIRNTDFETILGPGSTDTAPLRLVERSHVTTAAIPPYAPPVFPPIVGDDPWLDMQRAAARQDVEHSATDTLALLANAAAGTLGEGPLPALADLCFTHTQNDSVGELLDAALTIQGPSADDLRSQLTHPQVIVALAPAIDEAPEALLPRISRLLTRSDGTVALLCALDSAPARARILQIARATDANLGPHWAAELRRPGPDHALQAIHELSTRRDRPTTRALAQGVAHPSQRVRIAAIDALDGRWHTDLRAPIGAVLCDPLLGPRALRLVRQSRDRGMAARVLAAIAGPAFTQLPTDHRSDLLHTLARFREPPVRVWFTACLRGDCTPEDQALAVDALARSGGVYGRAVLIDVSEHQELSLALRSRISEATGGTLEIL